MNYMKHFFTSCFIIFVLIGCKKTEDVQPQVIVPVSTTNPDTQQVSPAVQQNVRLTPEVQKEKVKTHNGALEVFANLPPGGPIPPDMLPPKDIKLISGTDSTAIYSFTSGTTGMKCKAVLKRHIVKKDTSWTVLMASPL